MRRAAPVALAALLLAVSGAPAPAATQPGLPNVTTGHRPGPDALYLPPVSAPQLENARPWRAQPILVSGAQAYRDGEWLYQDYLHDDHGAQGTADQHDPFGISGHLFSPTAGTVTYPTDKAYAHNAADLVELRIRPLEDATAFRVTLNTLKDPNRTAFTIALGSSGTPRVWPHGAGVSSPAELFLTVHGTTAELRDATTGAVKAGGASASVDADRRQVDVRVPRAAWNPGRGKVRVTIGVGLWNTAAGGYLAPAPGDATATTPGGAAPTRAALFNVGPRFDEPLPDVTQYGGGVSIADAAVGARVDGAWWRERKQADALRLGDVSGFSAEVDFDKLADRRDDEAGVPTTGPLNRILASRFSFGQGIDPERVCYDIADDIDVGAKCEGRFVGQLQPYALYVPPGRRAPAGGWGMTLQLHSLSANYNQYSSSRNQSQFGDRAAGSLVATPSGRGPDGFYAGVPEADTFEVWADVARHYPVDADWAVVTGYSMGGFGTYRLLARWPDLFSRGMSTVGIPGTVSDQLPSLRNTPIMAWNAAGDELVNVRQAEEAATALAANGLRFVYDLFPGADHLTLATNDEYRPAAAFLGSHRVDRNPAHVTFVVDPREDSQQASAIADHAYWLSDLRVRDAKKSPTGTIDARSEAFGRGDPRPGGVQQSEGTLEGGERGPLAYHQRAQEWGPAPETPRSDTLVVKATNIDAATVDARRAGLSSAPRLVVESDGPLDLKIATLTAGGRKARCRRTVAVKLPRVRGRRVVSVTVTRLGRRVKRVRGRNVRRVVVRRPTRRAFALRLRMRMTVRGGRVLRVMVLRHYRACR